MLHARIAARAFNTPLLVEPSKAMAFLSGLGPRILGRRFEMADGVEPPDIAAIQPARASLLTGGLLEHSRQQGDAPYPVVDGIAVIEIAGVLIHRGGWIGQSSGQTSYEGIAAQIEAAASDPSVRAIALDIDSFGGEVAGVFDLADRIRAIRDSKPVWAFVAEHAFSAGYALAAQADRILVPRTGALGSIGVVVLHADLSGQLDQDGVRVTLIHSGRHKVDGNPYEPLPEGVRDDIQREIDVLRFLFAETVAAGRSGKLSQDAALATEAATFRGADAVAAGLADEVIDLARGFAGLRQRVAGRTGLATRRTGVQPRSLSTARGPTPSSTRASRASLPQTRQEADMAIETDPEITSDDRPPETNLDSGAPEDGGGDAEHDPSAGPEPAPAAAPDAEPVAVPLGAMSGAASNTPPDAAPGNLAEVSAQLREAAAQIAEIAAQAGRLGIAIDAAKALREGTKPEALRRLVLQRASEAADSRDIVAAPPSPVLPKATESPIIAAAKRAAKAGSKR
jgi:signal peptide peptidase SppA